jgi:hypothetical protein
MVWTLSLICQLDFDRESLRHSGDSPLWETSVIFEDPVAFVGREVQIRGHDHPTPRAIGRFFEGTRFAFNR